MITKQELCTSSELASTELVLEGTRFARWPRSFDGRHAIRALVDSL